MTSIEFWLNGDHIETRAYDAVLPAAGDEIDIARAGQQHCYRIVRLYKHFAADNHATPCAELAAV